MNQYQPQLDYQYSSKLQHTSQLRQEDTLAMLIDRLKLDNSQALALYQSLLESWQKTHQAKYSLYLTSSSDKVVSLLLQNLDAVNTPFLDESSKKMVNKFMDIMTEKIDGELMVQKCKLLAHRYVTFLPNMSSTIFTKSHPLMDFCERVSHIHIPPHAKTYAETLQVTLRKDEPKPIDPSNSSFEL